jgi:hypothetical protein
MAVRLLLGANPLSGSLFVLLHRRQDQVKILIWDRRRGRNAASGPPPALSAPGRSR